MNHIDLGATMTEGRARFRVWAPKVDKLAVRILNGRQKDLQLSPGPDGYFTTETSEASAGDRYFYVLNDSEQLPDPASRYQPEGVHGPSEITDPAAFQWRDQEWKGRPIKDFVIYELHVGTFSPEGTFEAIIPRLDYLEELGITALELMPVAQFPGNRNWGYDGVYPYAPQNSYGGPDGLKKLIDACHRKGMAVILDVVYNHLGPEGNYTEKYGYYFTSRYRTPWGDGVNYDGPYSDEVRRYFSCNALYWLTEYHIDALRLDAVHGILDFGAKHFLRELAEDVHGIEKNLNRKIFLIAESDLNDARVIGPPRTGGYGIDAQWNDDFHHSLHALLTGENTGYYEDFGEMKHLVKAFREGFVYSGQYSKSRRKRHGSSSKSRHADQFIVYSQSHDQVGNRMAGDRLCHNLSLEQLKLCSGVVILSPFIPLFFMGEEYGETAPFQYFISHTDEELVASVRKGRKEEFDSFKWQAEPSDPQAETTFMNSKVDIQRRKDGRHKFIFEFYKELLAFRKQMPVLSGPDKNDMEVQAFEKQKILMVRRWNGNDEVICIYSFNEKSGSAKLRVHGSWTKMLESSDTKWGGSEASAPPVLEGDESGVDLKLAPFSFIVYARLDRHFSHSDRSKFF